jgi:hypothetical protein
MRARLLPPEAVRALGVQLNGGRVTGWTERVGELLDVPATTVKAWATPPTSTAARSISGPACVALLGCVVMLEAGGLAALVRGVDAKYKKLVP